MGQRLVALASADSEVLIVAAIDAPNHPRLGEDAGSVAGLKAIGVPLAADFEAPVDVMVDFSLPAASEQIVEHCQRRKIPLVVATTGFSETQIGKLKEAARDIPLLWSPNMSLAVNLTMKLAQAAAKALRDRETDVEIIERHHRLKEDAPSGTALKFGQLIAAAMGQTAHRHGRQGRPGKRPHDEIGYHAIRAGDNPGEHTIIFALAGETVELSVRATSRDCYAAGALAAAKFLLGKKPGLYGMDDVLALKGLGDKGGQGFRELGI
jgi:4-hydroxy-tetrahydrodipicolinate reductase